MLELPEFMRIFVPAVVIPIAVFGGNWAFRYHSDYAQTAASDFLLAVLIFDGAVVTTAKEFEPFIKNAELRQIALHWHVILAVVVAFVWWLILTYAEPVVAAHYSSRRNKPGRLALVLTLMVCWMAIFVLVSTHIGFFVVQGASHHG